MTANSPDSPSQPTPEKVSLAYNADDDFAPSLAFFRIETADGRVARGWRIYAAKAFALALMVAGLVFAMTVLGMDRDTGALAQLGFALPLAVISWWGGIALAHKLAVHES